MKIELITYRDPDAGTDTRLFIDGVQVGYNHLDIDPGAGHFYSDLVESRDAEIKAATSEDVAAVLLRWYDHALESSHTVDDRVTVKIENTYACGRESTKDVVLMPPAWGQTIEDWFGDVVHEHTGDGHECGSHEHAMYEATVIEAPQFSTLVGEKMSWEG